MSNMAQVSREEDLSADEVEGIFNWVSNSKKKDWGEVKRLSMDEVSKRKGAREFVTVVSDVERACLLEVFYGKTAQTIREHLSGICNYFISGTTSGVMEGINNKIKLIMRLGYGLTNFNNLRSRLLGCCC
jgi:transposase